MIKTFKIIVICIFGSAFMSSCLKENSSNVYTEVYSVIKSNMGVLYFSSDEGIDLYLENGVFNSQWGVDGDRVLVGFYYNPYEITENTTRMSINVEMLMPIQTEHSALPSTADTVGNEVFLYDNSSEQQGISAWAVQNYLTAAFAIQYTDPAKHTFGFIEEPELFKNDTLFLSLWHNAKEDSKTKSGVSYIALNLSDYENYLSVRDSTVISLKYEAESLSAGSVNNYTYSLLYRKKYNLSGF